MRRPPAADIAVAAALGIAGVAFELTSGSTAPAVFTIPATVGYAAVLAFRRQAPLVSAVVAIALIVALGVFDPEGSQPTIILALGLAAFTLGYGLPLRLAAAVGASALAVMWAGIVAADAPAGDLAAVTLLYGTPWALGRVLRDRGERAREQSERAVEEERLRIARELHDVVAHSISVVSVQSQAVRRRLGPEHEREVEQLKLIEATVREAMGELRRLFGVLRANGVPAPTSPQPGLGQLDDLLATARADGLAVQERVDVDRRRVPPGLDLAAYRIVQEAITNVRRHAGARRLELTLREHGGRLEIEVVDDGRAAPGGDDRHAPGHGLTGMRERVALYGGTLEAGPRPSGGFVVRATLPLAEAPA